MRCLPSTVEPGVRHELRITIRTVGNGLQTHVLIIVTLTIAPFEVFIFLYQVYINIWFKSFKDNCILLLRVEFTNIIRFCQF